MLATDMRPMMVILHLNRLVQFFSVSLCTVR